MNYVVIVTRPYVAIEIHGPFPGYQHARDWIECVRKLDDTASYEIKRLTMAV